MLLSQGAPSAACLRSQQPRRQQASICCSHRQPDGAAGAPQQPSDTSPSSSANASPLTREHQQQLRTVVLATAVCCAFVSHVGAARAESTNWVPRRHHRHIGERFTDTWADSIVEVCLQGAHTALRQPSAFSGWRQVADAAHTLLTACLVVHTRARRRWSTPRPRA
jgi:hypothetical protein